MNAIQRAVFGAAALCIVGCANPDRSRDLANPNVSAKTLAEQVCSNCHGLTGVAVSPNFPNLVAQVETYTVAQLSGFKSHNRHDPAGFEYMWGLSRSLTEAQITGLAAYYAAQTPQRQPLEGDASRIEQGRGIYESGVAATNIPACAGCHGPEAKGQASYPRLAGQHADYLAKQLTVFQRTDERPEGSVMKVIAHDLTRENILDVAAFLQALPNR
jgi:cytochrome c553